MNEQYKLLVEKFKKICKEGYIKSEAKGLGSIGITLEQQLGKKSDSMYFPDFYGIEIKCSSRFSRYPISLFSVAFDGPTFPEINRLIEKYGYYDSVFKDKKVLELNINCVKYNESKSKFKFKLDIDQKQEKLFLSICDTKDKLIEKKSFVYLDTLYNHIKLKLKYMALIYASTKKTNGDTYFRYYKITLYELIGFDKFIELLKDGIIDVLLCSRISKSGKDFGKYKNKNLVFKLQKESINKLFNEIYTYNHDEDNNFNIINF